MDSIPIAAIAPLVVFVLAWVGYCWYDMSRRKVRHLPKWAWALIVLLSVPVGGIIYFLIGRESE